MIYTLYHMYILFIYIRPSPTGFIADIADYRLDWYKKWDNNTDLVAQ